MYHYLQFKMEYLKLKLLLEILI